MSTVYSSIRLIGHGFWLKKIRQKLGKVAKKNKFTI